MASQPIWYKPIIIRAGTPAKYLQMGYQYFLAVSNQPAGSLQATHEQLSAWFDKLPSPTIWANSPVDHILNFVIPSGTDTRWYTEGSPTGSLDTGGSTEGGFYSNPLPPQPGTPAYQALVDAALQGAGTAVGGGDILTIIKNFLSSISTAINQASIAMAAIQAAVNSVAGDVTRTVDTIRSAAQNTGDFISWLDSPSTLERLGLIIIGGALILFGVNAFILSFVDIQGVGQTAAAIAKVAA